MDRGLSLAQCVMSIFLECASLIIFWEEKLLFKSYGMKSQCANEFESFLHTFEINDAWELHVLGGQLVNQAWLATEE